MGYHKANLSHQPYAHWRVKALAIFGWMLGVQFHVRGIPFGGGYQRAAWDGVLVTGESSP